MVASAAAVLTLALAGCAGSLTATAKGDAGAGQPGSEAVPVRTAEALVRRLLDNSATPTPAPTATPLPRPTCPGAIWWFDAGNYAGTLATVEGRVSEARRVEAGGQQLLVLSLGQRFPDPNRVEVRLPGDGGGIAPLGPDAYVGQTVCATGRVELDQALPTLALGSDSDIRLAP